MLLSESEYFIAIKAAIEASKAVLEVYHTDFGIELKSDGSPITLADQKANDIICAALNKTGYHVISEESPKGSYSKRMNNSFVWLVDPVDGTKEFTHRNGEFTVNIALIHDKEPVFGIVTAPALNQGWVGWKNKGAFKIHQLDTLIGKLPLLSYKDVMNYSSPILPSPGQTKPTIALSLSHLTQNTLNMLKTLFGDETNYIKLRKGSSLKFCWVAEGLADYYIRADEINEWDTAAGHAVLLASGGQLITWPKGKKLQYNKENLINEGFIAASGNADLKSLELKLPL
jgi:3'(2'), 5'-bisphosphate nucleotidase